MKYHNDGMLRHEQDSTLWIRPAAQRHTLTRAEYLPLIILASLLAGLLAYVFLG